MKRLLIITAVTTLAAALSAPAIAGPGPHGGPGWGAPPPAWSAPAPGHWDRGFRPYHRHYYHHDWDWAWPLGVGAAVLATAAVLNIGSSATKYVEINTPQPAASLPPPPPAVDYFYCPASHGYYPTVPRCPTGWLKISPQ